jgi:hypothetical protein
VVSTTCTNCGKPSGGKFCRHCGASLAGAAPSCIKCGQALAGNARFCAGCGTPAGAGPEALNSNAKLAWFAAGGVTVALIGGAMLALARPAQPAAVSASNAAGVAAGDEATTTDISTMSPRERFDRLFNRIMRSAETGDAATVSTFSPMAMQAYQMLDTVDADARYHASLILLHTEDVAGARALADTILTQTPGHLFGYVIKGTIARFQQDQNALDQSYADFLKHYDTETKANRPEYADHPRALEDFLAAARAARGQT